MVLTDRIRSEELVAPAGLSHDPERGIYRVLVARWGEAIEGPHKHAGTRFDRGDVRLPDRAALQKLPVNIDHGSEEIGVILEAITDEAGLWVSAKFGDQGRYLLAIGFRGVSLETDDEGRLSGLALAVKAPAGLPSSQVLVDGPLHVCDRVPQPAAVTSSEPTRSLLPDPFRQRSGTLMGSGVKPPVGPAEWSVPSFDPRPVAVSMTEAQLEAEVARVRVQEEDRQRSLAEAADWDDWYAAYLREVRAEHERMQREDDEAERRRAEPERQRPWQSLDVWLDQNVGRLEESL